MSGQNNNEQQQQQPLSLEAPEIGAWTSGQHLPLYARVDYGNLAPLTLDGWRPSIWDVMRNSFNLGLDSNPMACAGRLADVYLSDYNDVFYDTVTDSDILDLLDRDEPVLNERMPLDKQQELIDAAGLGDVMKPYESYSESVLKDIIEDKKVERARGFVAGKQGAWQMPFSLAAAFAAGVLDPVNIASAFVPVLGEQRLLSMLSLAGGPFGRAGVRAMAGAANGAAGAAMLEPLMSAGHRAAQLDYDMTMSLCNIGFGAVMGAAIGPVAGAVGEWLRARRDPFHTEAWEYLKPTAESEAVTRELAGAMERARLGAAPWLDANAVREESRQTAMLFDQRLRNLAYKSGKDLPTLYGEMGLSIRNGEVFNQNVARLDREARGLEQELAELQARRELAEAYPMLRFEDTLALEAETLSRLETARANLAEARRAQERDIAEMMGGDTLYAGEVRPDPAKVQEAFEKLEPVRIDNVILQTDTNVGRYGKLREAAINDFKTLHPNGLKLHNQDSGHSATMNRQSVKDALYHGHDPLKTKLIQYIPELYESAIYIDNIPKPGMGPSHFYVNKIMVDGTEYIAGLLVREHQYGKKFYDLELTKVKRPDPANSPTAKPGEQTTETDNRGAVMNILRDRLGVNDGTGKVLFQHAPADPGSPDLQPAIMGATTFEDTRAIIRIFAKHDQTTLPHELAHVLRRSLGELASQANATPAIRKSFAHIERHFDVEHGSQWTIAQEEAFAEAFFKYLKTESAPAPQLIPAFQVMRERLLDVYADADAAGVSISPAMRKAIDGFLTMPVDEGNRMFLTTLADLNTRRWEQELMYQPGPHKPGEPVGFRENPSPALACDLDPTLPRSPDPGDLMPHDPEYLARLEESTESIRRYNDIRFEQDESTPLEVRQRWKAERDAAIAELDAEMARIPEEAKLMEEYVICLLNQA